jgi:hypothetical protein
MSQENVEIVRLIADWDDQQLVATLAEVLEEDE